LHRSHAHSIQTETKELSHVRHPCQYTIRFVLSWTVAGITLAVAGAALVLSLFALNDPHTSTGERQVPASVIVDPAPADQSPAAPGDCRRGPC